jgi:hypothetical protein
MVCAALSRTNAGVMVWWPSGTPFAALAIETSLAGRHIDVTRALDWKPQL